MASSSGIPPLSGMRCTRGRLFAPRLRPRPARTRYMGVLPMTAGNAGPASGRRRDFDAASDPETEVAHLLLLAYTFPDEVLQNPILPLLALQDHRTYLAILQRCADAHAHERWLSAREVAGPRLRPLGPLALSVTCPLRPLCAAFFARQAWLCRSPSVGCGQVCAFSCTSPP